MVVMIDSCGGMFTPCYRQLAPEANDAKPFVVMSLGGMVLGVLTILYGLIPDKTKE